MHPIAHDTLLVAQTLEALMLLCFGLAWPVNSLAMLRRKRHEGKGLTFTLIILCGYLCGATAKLALAFSSGAALPPVFWLYVLNGIAVGANAALYLHFKRRVSTVAAATGGHARCMCTGA